MAAILRDSVVVVRTRPRAIPLATMTTRNSIHGFPLLSHTRMRPNFGGLWDQAELRDKLSGQASLRVGCLLQALEQCGRSNKGAGEEQGLGGKRGRCPPAFSMFLTHQDPGTGYWTSSTLFAWQLKGREEKGRRVPFEFFSFSFHTFFPHAGLLLAREVQ